MAQFQRKPKDDWIEFEEPPGPRSGEQAPVPLDGRCEARPPLEFDAASPSVSARPFLFLGLGIVSLSVLGIETGHLVATVVVLGCTAVLVGILIAVCVSALDNTPAGR